MQIWGIPGKKRGHASLCWSSMGTAGPVHVFLEDKWAVGRKLEGSLCPELVIPARSVAPGLLHHTSSTAVSQKGGEEGEEGEHGERNAAPRAGILILRGCEI